MNCRASAPRSSWQIECYVNVIDKIFTAAALDFSPSSFIMSRAPWGDLMKPFRLLALTSCFLVLSTAAVLYAHECPYSSVNPRLEHAKLQADFNVHRAAIEGRVALGQLRVEKKVVTRLYQQHVLTAEEYSNRLKEIGRQEHAVRLQMLKAKIAALKSVLNISSTDVESLGKLRRLRADLESEQRVANSCGTENRSVAD